MTPYSLTSLPPLLVTSPAKTMRVLLEACLRFKVVGQPRPAGRDQEATASLLSSPTPSKTSLPSGTTSPTLTMAVPLTPHQHKKPSSSSLRTLATRVMLKPNCNLCICLPLHAFFHDLEFFCYPHILNTPSIAFYVLCPSFEAFETEIYYLP